ncbi:DUF6036 family nucleotidyltransferase [Rummeliibacillus stabekisii]|uniref:DUF6036 family nucleotidyltransferase n=1 Tax=Rummeliibacillus stabekisii TaxID=241244 RepID=UPI0020403B88|nr:DUF6036 family nucleotidyltransferase [Rummeliibacillus stabekisii]MCM3317991.1 DUF6036 family nucleotidyltransferase [Rummeliibacillus stabekisii]
MGAYGPTIENTDAIIDKLELLDMVCLKQGVNAELLVLGGSALLLLMAYNEREFRPTRDIDVTLISSSDETTILSLLQQLRIDTVDSIIELPPLEDLRHPKHEKMEIEVGLQAIRVYVPKPEYLACTKLFSRRQKDLDDLLQSDLLLLCNKDELLSLVEDYKVEFLFLSNPDVNVHQLDEIMRVKGII